MTSSTASMRMELDRIGGEAELIAYSNNGVIKEAYFVTRAPVRGFEKMVMGKDPIFVVNAVMRICGICHAAHGIASSEAFEDAMGIAPPYNGRILREAIGLINRIQSHLLHLTLMLPDITPREKLGQYTIRVIKLYNTVSEILGSLGGSPTHPSYIVIGGISKMPSENMVAKTIEKTKKFIEEYKQLLQDLETDYTEKVDVLRSRRYHVKYIATHLFYGDKYNISLDKIRILRYEEYRGNNIPEEARRTTSMIALYADEKVEVGPRARLAIYRNFTGNTLWDIQEARFKEIMIDTEQILSLLDKIEYGEPTYTKILTYRRGKGVGVYEAPRGTLIHWVELDDNGRVKKYRIVVPTMFNIPHMEDAAIGFREEYVDLVPRIYDPCVPCSTHVIRLSG